MPRRPPTQLTLDRERRAWELRLQCLSYQRIGEELGITRQAVSDALERYEKKLVERLVKRAEAVKLRQTQQLDHVVSEAIDAWERSKLDAESEETTEEQVEIGQAKMPATQTRIKRTRKGQTGDPRHLENVLKGLAAIRKIWGLEGADKDDAESKPKWPGILPVREIVVVRSREEGQVIDVTPASVPARALSDSSHAGRHSQTSA